MSTLQHINSVVNYNWPELSRKYPGFDKPQIVPAETLRGLAPVYLRSVIDQDPTSMYMFIAGEPTKGDCSREKACEFFDELFYEKLQMPSSFEVDEGYTREEAIDKEVLPPATNQQFRSFYDEQMAKVDAEEARKRRIEDLGFDPDDGNTIDVDVDDDSSDVRAVGQAQSTAVGMPNKIFYCVDFHCQAGGMLGYSGGGAGGRLGGQRRPGGYLRESESPVSDILAVFKDLPESLKKDAEQIASGDDTIVIKHKDGKFTVVEDGKTVMERVSADEVKKSGKLGEKQVTVVTKDEIDKMLSECDSDPEKMMKEFVEKKENGEVEEDEYRRPKNQPHNLHKVDEGKDVEEDDDIEEDEYRRPKNQPHNLHQVDEDDEDETSSRRLSPADREKLVKAIEQRLLTSKGLIGRRLFNPIVKKSDEEHVLVPGLGKPITKNDCLALAQSFDDWKVVNHRNIDRDVPIFNALKRLLDPSDDRLGINVDIPDDAVEYKPGGLPRVDEKDDGEEAEDESEEEFELNESMVRFCDRLIRG